MSINALDIVMVVVLITVFFILISPKLRNNTGWSAMVTPMASIIGSGFLVSVPLMASSVGAWALPAIVVLTAFAFCIGGAIRYNIQYGEKSFSDHSANKTILSIETLSHLVLTGAYFVSVAYYLLLLAAFGLKLAHIHDPIIEKAIATSLILIIVVVGVTRGLGGVERAEKFTVSANLAAIAALLVSLIIFGITLPAEYSWTAAFSEDYKLDMHNIRFLLGLLIIVQGFETSRFMGELYPPEVRIKAMRRAQLLSTAIYLLFFTLMIPLFPYFDSTGDVAGFIGEIYRVSLWLPFIVAGGAIASQFSAAVADSIGSSGLINEVTGRRITTRHAYLIIGFASVLVVWEANVVTVVALASRAFACFYFLQCIVAGMVARSRGDNKLVLWYGFLACASLAVVVFGIPASS